MFYSNFFTSSRFAVWPDQCRPAFFSHQNVATTDPQVFIPFFSFDRLCRWEDPLTPRTETFIDVDRPSDKEPHVHSRKVSFHFYFSSRALLWCSSAHKIHHDAALWRVDRHPSSPFQVYGRHWSVGFLNFDTQAFSTCWTKEVTSSFVAVGIPSIEFALEHRSTSSNFSCGMCIWFFRNLFLVTRSKIFSVHLCIFSLCPFIISFKSSIFSRAQSVPPPRLFQILEIVFLFHSSIQ